MKVKAIGKIAFDAVYEANAERVYRTALHCTIPITINMRQKRLRKRYF